MNSPFTNAWGCGLDIVLRFSPAVEGEKNATADRTAKGHRRQYTAPVLRRRFSYTSAI